MAGSVNICVPCGICCDGHLFDHGRLNSGEQPLCASLGMVIQGSADTFVRFMQPCPLLDGDNGCTAYDSRPTICRTFRCRMLQDHDAKRVSDDDALAIIDKVHAMAWHQTLRPALLQLAPHATGSVRRHLALAQDAIAASADPADLRRRYGLVLMRTAALSKLLNSHFYTREKGDPAASADGVGDEG